MSSLLFHFTSKLWGKFCALKRSDCLFAMAAQKIDKKNGCFASKSNKTSAEYRKRPPVFEYPPLPKWETIYYLIFGCCIFLYAWIQVYKQSGLYLWDGWWSTYENDNLPYFGWKKKDTTNFEWRKWTPYAKQALPWFFGHFFVFNGAEKILANTKWWRIVVLVYWAICYIFLYKLILVVATVICGLTIFAIRRYTKRPLVVWAISAVLLHLSLNHINLIHTPQNYYIAVAFLSYKMLQYISFNLEECACARPENNAFWQGVFNMFWFAFYLPYHSSLIVPYRYFPDQIDQRRLKPRGWKNACFFGVRILFWYFFIEFFLHFMYFDAIMSDHDFLKQLPKDALVSVAYAAGHFFQIKYVVMFGMPAFFAKLDNMQPQDGPICIARVSLYSKIWRNFDRGLYQFFKEYIFLPICRPTFSLPRVVVGVFVSYGFVLLWHGLTHQYIVWIILNISELFLEQIFRRVYSIDAVKQFQKRLVTNVWFRRVLAFCQILPLALGLYAIFYFLADSQSGYIIVEKIFWEETVPVRWPFLVLLVVGYHYNQMCMDVERWQNTKFCVGQKSEKME